jgi:hypothetical protein
MRPIIYSILVVLLPGIILAQDEDDKIYTTTSGELIFSFASVDYAGNEEGSIMRFSPVINIQNLVNFDQSEKLGFFAGLSVRNVGFIYDVDETTRKKYRTYNVGIPVGVKIGNLENKFLFFGYELEIPVNYKEKTFVDEDRQDKKNYWFTSRVPTVNHSLMAGIQLPYGATIKFKYYLTNFFDEDFTASDGQGGTYKPYGDVNVNIFYFSLSFGLLKDTNFYYNKE